MIDASIEFPYHDVAALVRQMERARQVLGKNLGASVLMAMRYVVTSIAASTKVSKKYREYTQLPGKSRSGQNLIFAVATKYQTPKRKGKALRRSWQGNWREQLIYAPSEAALKRRRAVIIAMRGLAKESWMAAGARNKFQVPRTGATVDARNKAIMQKAARRWVTSESRLSGDDPYMMIGDRLRYISAAITGGPSTVGTAMERAARAMEHSIDKQAARSFGLS